MTNTIRVKSKCCPSVNTKPDDIDCAFKFEYIPPISLNNEDFDIFEVDIPVPLLISGIYNLNNYKLEAYKFRNKYYICATEIIRADELLKIQNFCQCYKCKLYWFDIRRCFTCGCCVGCLFSYDGDIFTSSQKIIDDSRKAYQQYINDNLNKKQD